LKNKTFLEFDRGRFTFYREGVGGWENFSFRLNSKLSTELDFSITRRKNRTIATGVGPTHAERIVFDFIPKKNALIVSRSITNTGKRPLKLEKIQDGRLDATAFVGLEGKGLNQISLRYMHTQNLQIENGVEWRPQYPYIRPLPFRSVHLNDGQGNPIPALVLTEEHYTKTLVEGDLRQLRFQRSWDFGLNGPGRRTDNPLRTWRAHERLLLAASPAVLTPGETEEVSRVFYQILEGVHPQNALDDYFAEVTKMYSFCGPKSPMRHGSVFCTWNYGTLSNIDEELILRRAKALAQKVPECTHFMIDYGYQRRIGSKRFINGIESFYPNPSIGYEPTLFPRGMKYIADEIRGTGLVPCIWFSPQVYLDSPLAKEHPEWLLRSARGSARMLPGSECGYLDPSAPGAKKFLTDVLDAMLVEWGYRGIKFDFMYHWFTLPHFRFRMGSGLEWQNWLFREIRRRIGSDGLFMTCISMSKGNPFPGQFADCYRCGLDIHDGTWDEQIKAVKSTLAPLLVEGRKTCLLNMDSAGFGDNPDNESLLRLTWLFITEGILEIGGPIERMPARQLRLLRKLLAHADRGHRVHCLDERAFTGEPFPEILTVEYPKNSRTARRGVTRHIALFNWSDRAKPIGAKREDLGVTPDERLVDFWSGRAIRNRAELVETLAPHSARLIEAR